MAPLVSFQAPCSRSLEFHRVLTTSCCLSPAPLWKDSPLFLRMATPSSHGQTYQGPLQLHPSRKASLSGTLFAMQEMIGTRVRVLACAPVPLAPRSAHAARSAHTTPCHTAFCFYHSDDASVLESIICISCSHLQWQITHII